MKNEGAYLLRENTGTSGLEETTRTAVAVLAHWNIPHLIAGGIAVHLGLRKLYEETWDAIQAESPNGN